MEEKLVLAATERCECRRPPVPRKAPWLVYPHGKRRKDQIFIDYYIDDNNTYRKSIPELSSKYFMYWQSPSNQGWLVILCHSSTTDHHQYSNYSSKWKMGDCFLWNPVSLKTIQLPSLSHWIKTNKSTQCIQNCVLSSPPPSTTNHVDDDGSMVFFLFQTTKYLLVFCHLGGKHWRVKELFVEVNAVRSLICFKGKLHVPCYDNLHLVIDFFFAPDDEDDGDETLSVTSFHVSEETLSPIPQLSMSCLYDADYVESCDELFKVIRFYEFFSKEVIDIQVFRMDFSLMDWEKVKSLDDHVLFLGKQTAGSCQAADLGLKRGCVYYTQPNDKTLYAFELEDGRIYSYLSSLNLPTPWFSPNWIMMPTTKRAADDGRRRTEVMLCYSEEVNININAEENRTSIIDENEGDMNDGNRGELVESGTWGTFSEDILELIASYLRPVDYMNFREVCKANHLAIPAMNWRSSSTEIIKNTSLSPWMIFLRRRDAIYNFVDPLHNNNKYCMNLQGFLLDATIRFSKEGWLLMSRGQKALFFFNPFTRAMIHLPDLPENRRCEFYGMSFSSLPTSSDCVVFAITEWGGDAVYIYSIARRDYSWSHGVVDNMNLPSTKTCMRFTPYRNNPVFYNGVFYCLDRTGTLGVFDLEGDITWKVLANPQAPCNSIYHCFLAECEGNLLSVFLGSLGKWIKIYRLDLSKMLWVKVESLGKYMLFISNTSSVSAIAPESRMENKIYFIRFHGEGIVYFSLDTGRYHSFGSQHSAEDFNNTAEQFCCSWIEPNWSQTTVQELDWLS